MTYSEFLNISDLCRNPDVEMNYKDRFTSFEFTLKSTPALNGEGSLYVLTCEPDSCAAIFDMLERFDIVFYNPIATKFLFCH